LRRLLNELGVKHANVHVAETYEKALVVLETQQPTVVFTEYNLGAQTALDLFREYARFVPNRIGSVFIVISADNAPASIIALADADVDGVLVRPLNLKDIREKFVEQAVLKAQPSNYIKMIEAGRRFMEGEKPEQALRAYVGAQGLDPKPAKACYLEGSVHRSLGNADAAFEAFRRGLTFDARHYRCMAGLFEILCEQKRHAEAYEAGLAMLAHYPLHPRRIPEMIRLCIVNEKYDEVLRFTETAMELRLGDEVLSRYVVAGLFICGKHLLKNRRRSEALQVLKKAEMLSKNKPKILGEVIAALYVGGMAKDAEEMLRRAPPEVAASHEVRLAILESLHVMGLDMKVFHLSRELIHDGVSTIRLFEIALVQAKGLFRPDAVIQEILTLASKAFPERAAWLGELLTHTPEEKAAS
jgi:tetratricopeptide (TPR) repeat protein